MITVVTVEIIRNEENAVLSIAVLETLGGSEEISKNVWSSEQRKHIPEIPVGEEAPKVPVTLEPPATGEPEVNPGPPVPVPPARVDN